MTRAVLLAALAVLLSPFGELLAAPKKRSKAAGSRRPRTQALARLPGQGQVTSVTAQRAFVDRGAEDGLAVGMKLQLVRGARTGPLCELEAVGPHVAACKGGAVRVGDKFAVEKRAAKPVPRAPTAPALPAELAPRLERLEAWELPLIDLDRAGRLGDAGLRAEGGLVHASYAGLSSPDAVFHQERADVAVYGAGLAGGLSFGADASALVWSRRPAEFRSPHTAAAQLQVRELWLAWQFKNGFSAALGRLRPRHAPGAGLVDGAQVGYFARSGALAVGAYGGVAPSPVTLQPLGGPFTAGLFAAGRLGGDTVKTALFEPSVRLAWLGRPGANRFEGQALARLWVGTLFDARLEAAAGLGTGAAPASLDAVRLDVGGRVAGFLRLRASGRYSGGGDLWLGAAPIQPAQSVVADASAAAELPGGFTLLLQGGAVHDFAAALTQGRVGPELQLPPLLSGRLVFSLGYDEEFGWLPGRSGHLQVSVRPAERVGVWARAAVFHQSAVDRAAGLQGVDGSFSLALDVRLYRWLWLRGSGWARAGLGQGGVPAALAGQVGVGGAF